MVLKRQVVSLWSKLGASPNTVHLMGFGKSIRNLIRRTPSPACGPKPMLFTARRFPFGGRRPVPRRLVQTPARATLSPKGERAEFSQTPFSPAAGHPSERGFST
jgi:hypothetical protein